MDMEYLGNKELLKQHKTAFLASSTIPPDMGLKCYDWATAKHEGCVVSGFSSKLEQDVLHFLLKAKCPVILVLARCMYKVIPAELEEAMEEGRLLILSVSNATRQSKVTAHARNKYICEIADEILFVGVTEKSSLAELASAYKDKTATLANATGMGE